MDNKAKEIRHTIANPINSSDLINKLKGLAQSSTLIVPALLPEESEIGRTPPLSTQGIKNKAKNTKSRHKEKMLNILYSFLYD